MSLPPNLGNLPAELKIIIIEYIHRPADLKRLCLTCKSIRQCAIPKLYRRVVIDLRNCKWPKLNGFFKSGNPGPKYVEDLRFIPDDPSHKENANKIIRLVIQLIPQDALRKLRLPAMHTLDEDTALGLLLRQQQLSTVNLGMSSTTLRSISNMSAFPINWCASITTLCLPERLRSLDDVGVYSDVVKNAPHLRDLQIYTSTFTQSRSHEQRLSMWRRLVPHDKHTNSPLTLRLDRLVLDGINLAMTGLSFLEMIDFSSLTNLEIVDCSRPEQLMLVLTHSFLKRGCSLRRFRLRARDVVSFGELHCFLGCFSGLRSVHLTCNGRYGGVQKVFRISSLKKHYASLTQLYVFITGWDGDELVDLPLSQQCLRIVSTKFTALTSVALVLPLVDCLEDTDNNASWIDFSVALNLVVQLAHLKSVRLLSWPKIPDKGHFFHMLSSIRKVLAFADWDPLRIADLSKELYLDKLDGFAGLVLRHIAMSRRSTSDIRDLPVLSFGDIRGHSWLREATAPDYATSVPVRPVIYIPSTLHPMVGHVGSKIVGQRINFEDIQHVFPPNDDALVFNPYLDHDARFL